MSIASKSVERSETDDLVRRAQARQPDAIRTIIRRYNQRLYRLARAILRSDADAEEVLQEAYLRAFGAIGNFRGDASLSTWLSRITINEALGRLRHQRRQARLNLEVAEQQKSSVIPFPLAVSAEDPERTMGQRQLLQMVEQASDTLPEVYRVVFIARVVEGMSVEETASVLDLQPATVKTRLHRARVLIKQEIEARIGPLVLDAFPFAGKRCDRLTENVMMKLGFVEPR